MFSSFRRSSAFVLSIYGHSDETNQIQLIVFWRMGFMGFFLLCSCSHRCNRWSNTFYLYRSTGLDAIRVYMDTHPCHACPPTAYRRRLYMLGSSQVRHPTTIAKTVSNNLAIPKSTDRPIDRPIDRSTDRPLTTSPRRPEQQ